MATRSIISTHTGFISYAHDDTPLAEKFVKLMRPRTQIRTDMRLDLWWDRSLNAGGWWDHDIHDQLEAADIGLFLLTANFFASSYIIDNELRHFLDRPHKLTIPVMLEDVPLGSTEMHGLGDLQIFRYRMPGTNDLRSFERCGPSTKKAFCNELLSQIARQLP